MQKLLIVLVVFSLLLTLIPQATADSSSNLFSDIARDQKVIWTSPLRAKDHWKWIIPLSVTTAFLINRDAPWLHDYKPSRNTVRLSNDVSLLGSMPVTFGAAGAVYLLGKARHDKGLSRTGVLGLEALIDATIVSYGLKLATQRERPHTGDLDGSFFEGGSSFPSGHSVAVWSVATAMVNARPQPLGVQIAAYGVAAAVSVSRVTGEKHYPSDVLAGSVIGFLIGRYVARQGMMQDKVLILPMMSRQGAGLNVLYSW